MKLIVLGATGGTGLELVSQAVEHGHAVTAFVRSPERLQRFAGRIDVVRGDLLSSAELQRVVAGHDAVLSSFGPMSKDDATLLGRFAVALTTAMRQAKIARVVVESTAFLFRDSYLPPAYLVGRLFFPQIVADATEMEGVFRQSGLDWTLVRPPRLTNKARTAKYRSREDHLPGFGFTISRADVADYMIKAVEDRAAIRKVVGVCN